MRIRMLKLPGAQFSLSPEELNFQKLQRAPDESQLQAILGNVGTQSYEWWKLGLQRAGSVAAIHAGINRRIGTGFMVAATEFGLGQPNECLLITNFHVINAKGAAGGLRPDDVQVAFEAIDAKRHYRIKEILWESPIDRHDACLIRLEDMPTNEASAIPVARSLPVIEETAKVYVIGHPGGGELEFSFQDNALLDHEGPTNGMPAIPGVCRLHYRAPTEKGSSGSPVFNAAYWEAIALHHAGGVLPELNRKPGTHLANEGVSLISIAAAVAATASGQP
jgi:hypothetical protein